MLGLVLLGAVAPTLVSWGLGRGLIGDVIGRRVNGTVAIGGLELGWFGNQSVRGLEINGADGTTAAQLDLAINAGLFELLTGRARAIEVAVSGSVRGELRPDGSTSFEDLLVHNTRPAGAGPAPAPGDSRSDLRGVPPTTLRLAGLTITLTEQGSARVIGFNDVNGVLSYAPGEQVTLDLAADVTGGTTPGSVEVMGRIDGLFDSDGVLTPALASGRLDVRLRHVPVPRTDRPTELRSLALSITSDDPTDRVDLTVEVDAMIDGTESGRLSGAITVVRLVGPDGSVSVGLDQIRGHLEGRSVPTALLQGALRATPIVATRDIGPTIDIDADFQPDGSVTILVRAASVQLDIAGTVDGSQQFQTDRVHLEVAVSPELVEATTGLWIDRAADVVVDLDSLRVPQGPDQRGLYDLAASGRVSLRTPVALSTGPDRPSVLLEKLELAFVVPSLGEGASFDGEALLGGAEATIELAAENLLDEHGALSPTAIKVAGVASARNIDRELMASLLPEHADIIDAAVNGPLAVTVTTTFENRTLQVRLRAEADGLDLAVAASMRDGTLHVTDAVGTLEVTPALFAALQQDAEEPVVLAAPVPTTIELDPFDLPWSGPIRGRLTLREATLERVPGLVEPIGVRDLQTVVVAHTGPVPTVSLEGSVRLRRATTHTDVAAVSWALSATAGDSVTIRELTIEGSRLAVRDLDAMTGNAVGQELAEWLGDTGSVVLKLKHHGAASSEANISVDFPYLTGDFTAQLDGDMVSITARNPRVTLPRAALQRRLTPPAAAVAAPRTASLPSPTIRVVADVPMTLAIRSLRVPRGMLTGERIDADAVDIDLELRGGPLVLDDPTIGRNSIEDLRIALACTDLNVGLAMRVDGRIRFAGATRTGRIQLNGTVTELVTDGVLSADRATLALKATVEGLHTAVVDALADMQGLLVAAVGPRVDAVATARNFSRNTGVLDVRIDTPNGWLEGRVRGVRNSLVIDPRHPVRAELELTPPLRQRLLYKIHPLLADIRTTEQPLRVTIGESSVPLDGDVTRLNADVDITVGRVEIDSGSKSLALLQLFNAANARTIPGEVQPIKVRIRNGIVTYERFVVTLDKYTFAYSGSINLKTGSVNLRTEVPLEGLAGTFHELDGYADDLVVPLVTTGTFGNLRTEIEPEFLAEAALTIGVRRGFRELEKETGVPIGDIFDSIFGKKKKKR